MTWNDIKSLCLDLLCLDQLTADEEMEYSLKFQRLANQGLVSIANAVKPKIAEYDCYVYPKIITGVIGEGETIADVVVANNVIYVINNTRYALINDVIYCDDATQTTYPFVHLHVVEEPIIMPDDFLSFGNMVGSKITKNKDVYSGKEEQVLERFVPAHYVTRSGIYLKDAGKYVIYYNALWEEITDNYTKQTEYDDNNKPIAGANAELPQDKSILAILPQYIAFNVIAQDDVQRATVLKNDYELLLARLDNTTQYDTEDYSSVKGWY